MSVIINYPKQFSKEYKDFIIVLSKLSELKNIKNLPFDVNIFIKNKELEKILQDNHYYECFVKSNKYKYFHNIKNHWLNHNDSMHLLQLSVPHLFLIVQYPSQFYYQLGLHNYYKIQSILVHDHF